MRLSFISWLLPKTAYPAFLAAIPVRIQLIMPPACRYFTPCYYLCAMKYLFLSIGSLSLVLGVIGIFLPLLPTTPFLLLSAAMFFRSSPRAYRWLLGHRYLGPYIRSFREERSIPLRAKIVALSLLWLTSLHCVVLIFDSWWLRAAMLAVAVGVSCYILSFKTRRDAG